MSRPIAALLEEQPTHHSAENRLVDMLSRELALSRQESAAGLKRVEGSVNRMGDRFERAQQAIYVLAGLLVIGMIATAGGSLWIQYSRAQGVSIGTGSAASTHTPETP